MGVFGTNVQPLEAIGKYWITQALETVGRREFFGTIESHDDDNGLFTSFFGHNDILTFLYFNIFLYFYILTYFFILTYFYILKIFLYFNIFFLFF